MKQPPPFWPIVLQHCPASAIIGQHWFMPLQTGSWLAQQVPLQFTVMQPPELLLLLFDPLLLPPPLLELLVEPLLVELLLLDPPLLEAPLLEALLVEPPLLEPLLLPPELLPLEPSLP